MPTDSSRRNKILIQGDPQTISKQRVETAIRAVIDMVRQIPPSPSVPAPHPSLAAQVPRDASGNLLYSFERLANFAGLRLQAGTTTKTSSKKQLAAGQIPPHQLAFVETAVYMSGDDGKRVYACKRCRAREERRRQNKDAARKKAAVTSDSETAATTPAPRPSLHPPSEDYITGENAAQYDPHRIGQVVEEPQWDPTVPDWRHEIVLFNSPPDVAVKDGSCYWLPFRVICYCKCHGEKVGFRIKFTLRTYDGRIIASDMTHPIKITDDHKTDAKSKPRIERFTQASGPAQPRARKGRMSTASSQRHSPAPSESEMSVTSEVGAVTHKQTPDARAGKPYERPPSQSPAVPTTNLPFDFINGGGERPRLSRQASSSSYVSQPDLTSWLPDVAAQSTVSPDALRRSNFSQLVGMTNMNNNLSTPSSLAPSPHHVNGATNNLGVNGLPNDIYAHNDLNLTHGKLDLAQFGSGSFSTQSPDDVDMTNVTSELENMLFGGSSHASVASSYQDDHSSVFSGFNTGSIFSDSGLPPDNSLEDMIDFSGGESSAVSPMQVNLSPTTNMGSLDLQNPARSPFSQAGPLQAVPPNTESDSQTRALLALFAQQQAQNQQQQQQRRQQQQQQQQQQHTPVQPPPILSHVIPGEGDMAGGMPVAIAGRLFTPETVITFGGRPAITTFVSDSFLQCTLPASPCPGDVEVTVQGAMMDPTLPPQMFRYVGMDKEMMRLMLEVRQLHQQSSDPALRLVDHLARSANNSDFSDHSSMSPNAGGNKSSPFDAQAPGPADKEAAPTSDLQTTLITFLATLDEESPGSLRRSGAVNHRNKARQTLLHIAAAMGYHRLLRRLVVVGSHTDLQDTNGFTPLAFAAFCGQTQCARVLIEAGASYDVPTIFGEMPLDLAKTVEQSDVEALLLSAVWSTIPAAEGGATSEPSDNVESGSEIDDDNPSSESDDGASVGQASRVLRVRRPSRRIVKKKQRSSVELARRDSPIMISRRASPVGPPMAITGPPAHGEAPPPYTPPDNASWMARTLSNISHPLSDTLHGLPSLWNSEKEAPHGWVAFPAPSWDTLQKMTSPEEVKLFTQAMAAAAFNAVVQSGATTSTMGEPAPVRTPPKKKRHQRRASEDSRSSSQASTSQVVKQVKQDRMLYLFWLPVLLFVGFWLLVTALPIATGFCLLNARQISRAIKQRL